MKWMLLLAGIIFGNIFFSHAQMLNPTQAQATIRADSLKKHIAYLGSDELQGRGTGTQGERLAADYISRHFKALKLKPLTENGSYYQQIPMHGSIPHSSSEFVLFQQNKSHKLAFKRDYLLYKTGAQTFIPQPLPLVFVGYGIIAPEFDYNDYQTLDVDGKIVVFLSGEPFSTDSTYFNGPLTTVYAYPEAKQRIAISQGARGSIMIPSPRDFKRRNWRYWVNMFSFEDVHLAYSVTSNLSIVINPNAAVKLFESAEYDLKSVFKQDQQGLIHSFPLKTKISFKGKFTERDFFAVNVLALLEGQQRRPNDNYLLISAHYDHLGIGRPVAGDSIYNGVFDNAAGVAAVLEIARAFTLLKERPKHAIIFLLTTGEEKGLLGASYYTENPVRPLYKTLANVNIDGLAMFDQFNEVIGIGAHYSTLDEIFEQEAEKAGLSVGTLPPAFSEFESFARSDQIAFARSGIPALLIAEGLDYRNLSPEAGLQKILDWNRKIYHTPFDDINQEMNLAAAEQHCRFLFTFCHTLANLTSLPTWKPGTTFKNARLRSIAEKR